MEQGYPNPNSPNIQIINDPNRPNQNVLQTQPLNQQQQQANMAPSTATNAPSRVINRNYLQIQSNNQMNKSNTLNSMNTNNIFSSMSQGNTVQDPKRNRSISRSLRSLFTRSSSTNKGTIRNYMSRDKSYDSPNTLYSNYDIQSGLCFFCFKILNFFYNWLKLFKNSRCSKSQKEQKVCG